MGWKGAVRSINAEMKRQAREDEKRHRQHLKEAGRQEASSIVYEQEGFLDEIVSLHQNCRADFDWESIQHEEEPDEPENLQPLAAEAEAKLNNFKPNIIDHIFKTAEWRKKRLANKVQEARSLDEKNYKVSLENYQLCKNEWDKKQSLAQRLKIEKKAVLEALQEYLEIQDLSIGQDVKFEVSDDMKVDVNLKVMPFEEVIPEEQYSLRQSGTLSTKKMPKGKALELYQDHVCSALIRVARETLGVTLPPPADFLEVKGMLHQFNDLENIKDEDASVLNHSFSKWISNLLLRELDEFLQYYLLAIYETCLIIKFVGKEITPADIVNAKGAAKDFEESSLKERLKALRQDYDIDFTHKPELYSLHKLRHIFAHFDGIVQKKFCNDSGVLEVAWPVNSVKLKHRKTGKLVPFEKVPRPFNKEYGEVQINWLSNPNKTEYAVKDKIELSHAELNQLVFFYLYVFNQLHDGLVEYARENGIKVRPFQKYSLTPSLCLIGEEEIHD